MQTTGDEPYCVNCGYQLTGATESSKCPECGKPLVEVLRRPSFPHPPRGRRYRSARTIWGLPLVHVATGAHDDGPIGHARGIVAIGDDARGVIAVGGRAMGGVCVGGVAIGGLAIGGCAVGLVAIGGAAVGLAAIGGAAAGLFWATGGASVWLKW